jgi:hypothetical protein
MRRPRGSDMLIPASHNYPISPRRPIQFSFGKTGSLFQFLGHGEMPLEMGSVRLVARHPPRCLGTFSFSCGPRPPVLRAMTRILDLVQPVVTGWR